MVELSYITMVITCGDIVFQLMSVSVNLIIFKCLNTLTDSCILFRYFKLHAQLGISYVGLYFIIMYHGIT